MDPIEAHKQEFDKVINFLKEDVKSLRTARASTDLVAHIMVNAYGTKMPLRELASISIPESRTLVIEVWDNNILKEIEKALSSTDLGAVPQIHEGLIRLTLPPLNEETRHRLVKVLQTKLENTRGSLRALRDSVREEIIKAERAKELTEDDKYRLLEDLDKLSSEKQNEIKSIGEQKEKEITTL